MSSDMPMYRHDDEALPAKPIVLPDCNGLIYQPIRFTHEEEEWLEMLQELNRTLASIVEELRITPDMIGETTNR